MLRTTQVTNAWNERRLKAAAEFRYARDRRKFNAFLLDLVHVQEHPSSRYKGWSGKPETGRRNCLGLNCVEVSTVLLYQRFSPTTAQKVKVLCRKYSLARFDGSWIAGPLAEQLGCSRECQLWHLTALDEPLDHKPVKLVEVEWDDEDGAVGAACNAVMSAEGLKYGDDCIFTGAKELVDAFRAGDIPWKRFMKLVQACVAMRKGVRVKSGCRVFDALTMLPKEFRDHFRHADSGTALAEICDQPAGQVTDGRVFVALVAKEWERMGLGRLSGWCDDKAVSMFWNMATGKEPYFYELFWKECVKEGVLGLDGDDKNKYKKSKQLFMYMANPSASDMMYSACAWVNRYCKGVKPWRADSWKAWRAMCKVDRTLGKFLLACRLTGASDAWYRAYTFVEMCVDETVEGYFKSRGWVTHRLHDARYSCDPELVEMRKKGGKEWGQKLQAVVVLRKMGLTELTEDSMQRMSGRATVARSIEGIGKLVKGHATELKWALEPFTALTEERRALIRAEMWRMDSDPEYFGEDGLLQVAQEEQDFDVDRHAGEWMFVKTKRGA